MDFDKMKEGFENVTGKMGNMTDSTKGAFEKLSDAVGRMKNVKVVPSIGAKGGVEFNDAGKNFILDKKVIGISVRCGYIVDGIQVLYEDNLKSDMHGSRTGGGEKNIFFDEGDEVSLIEADYGVPFGDLEGAVSKLTIHTQNGNVYGPYGSGKSESKIQLEVPSGGRFIGLCGNVGTEGNGGYVSALGLLYYED